MADAAKPVFDGDIEIGQASTPAEIEALLIERGAWPKHARAAVLTRLVITANAWHIIPAGPVEEMVAATRAAIAKAGKAAP
jgi:hypothetical protein